MGLSTSGNQQYWWETSPILGGGACSSPLLHHSLSPSPSVAPSLHQTARGVHGPQSPSSRSREMTGSTEFLGKEERPVATFATLLLMISPSLRVHQVSTCNGICQILVSCLPQQAHQSRDSVTVLDGNFVVRVSSIWNVLQSSTGRVMHLLLWVVQHRHQSRNSLQAPYFRFDLHIGWDAVSQWGVHKKKKKNPNMLIQAILNQGW